MVETFYSDIDKLKALVKHKKVGLFVNHTAVYNFTYLWDILRKENISISAVFSPEHGLFGVEQDQVPVDDEKYSALPIISLYGTDFQSLTPNENSCDNIDLIIFDIQDIGARYYTYINSMIYFMKFLHKKDIEFIVIDRPNPINGELLEGPVLQQKYSSFVGVLPVPVRHGLTCGESALFAEKHFNLDLKLTVLKMKGWKRNMFYEETGLQWFAPSPNMPTIETAIVYPGMCLLEGTNISEGRGTTQPFLICGAPFINAEQFSEVINNYNCNGVFVKPFLFKPQFNKFSGEILSGISIHVTDRRIFNSFDFGITIIHTLYTMYPEFQFLDSVYEFNSEYPAVDLLCGTSGVREQIINGNSIESIIGTYQSELQQHKHQMFDNHLY